MGRSWARRSQAPGLRHEWPCSRAALGGGKSDHDRSRTPPPNRLVLTVVGLATRTTPHGPASPCPGHLPPLDRFRPCSVRRRGGLQGGVLLRVAFIGRPLWAQSGNPARGLPEQGLRIYKEESHDTQSSSPPTSFVRPQGWTKDADGLMAAWCTTLPRLRPPVPYLHAPRSHPSLPTSSRAQRQRATTSCAMCRPETRRAFALAGL